MAATDYVELDDLKSHLGLSGTSEFDDRLTVVAAAVSRGIDAHCQRHFYQDGEESDPVSRVFDARTSRWLRLGDHPVQTGAVTVLSDLVEATDVETDDDRDGTFETTWDDGDYQLLPLNAGPYQELRAVDTRTFPSVRHRRGLVRVWGVWGFETVPDPVPEAGLIKAAREFKRKDSPEGVSGVDQFGVIRISTRDDPDVVRMLAPLIHPHVGLVA